MTKRGSGIRSQTNAAKYIGSTQFFILVLCQLLDDGGYSILLIKLVLFKLSILHLLAEGKPMKKKHILLPFLLLKNIVYCGLLEERKVGTI